MIENVSGRLGRMIAALCMCLVFMAGTCMAASLKSHPTVGILPLEKRGLVSEGWDREEMGAAVEYVYADLQDSGRFKLLDRTRQRALVDEYAHDMSGLVDEDTAPAIGNQYGAQYLLMGSIIGVTRSRRLLACASSTRRQVRSCWRRRAARARTTRSSRRHSASSASARSRSTKGRSMKRSRMPSTRPSTARAACSRAWTARQGQSADGCVLCL